MKLTVAAAVVLLSVGSAELAMAGGMRGSMFNLPPAKDPILSNERIGIVIVDVEDNRVVTPLDDTGKAFPADQFRGQLFVVTGPQFSFRLPPREGESRRVVNVQFFRANATEDIPAEQTQILQSVVIANDAARILEMDVVVPRPREMPATQSPPHGCQCWVPCRERQCRRWNRRGCR